MITKCFEELYSYPELKTLLLESDQISSTVKGKLNDISFPEAVSPVHKSCLSSSYRSNAGNNAQSMLLEAALKRTILSVNIKQPPAKNKTFLPLPPGSCVVSFNDSTKTIYTAVSRGASTLDREAPACQ